MTTFRTYMLRKAYENVRKNGDKLAETDTLIDWEAFRPIIAPMYRNRTSRGGRPNVDEVVMVKLLVLQQWYGLSDLELERQVDDRISFQRFLGYPEKAPDYSTVWQFRERLAETGRDRAVWEELQRQLDEKGLKVRKGVVQDATFITSDPGHAPADKPRGGEARRKHHMRPAVEAAYAFLKTQYGMKVNKVRGLVNVAVYALYSVLCHVLTREAAENIGRPDKAVSPTFFNT